MPDPVEIAALILEPHFDAVRDRFAAYSPKPGVRLDKLKHTKFVVDPGVRNSPRHYAACREDGRLVLLAPECVELPLENLVALLIHEMGHAADFAYAGRWIMSRPDEPAIWVGDDDGKQARKWSNLWNERSQDAIEQSADCIGWAVTGRKITYCGECMVQCFSGIERPAGLR